MSLNGILLVIIKKTNKQKEILHIPLISWWLTEINTGKSGKNNIGGM